MGKKRIAKTEHEKILSLYQSGKTYQEIADIYGVTRQAIGKIASNHGMTRNDGGASLEYRRRAKEKKAARDAKCLEKYGYTYDEYKKIVESRCNQPAIAFRSQKYRARARGIEWNMSFSEWWEIWQESGCWELRGREYGNYCMARFNDSGPYEVGNVEIVSVTQNIRETRLREARARAV